MKYLILSIILFLNYNLISQNLNFDFQEYAPLKSGRNQSSIFQRQQWYIHLQLTNL